MYNVKAKKILSVVCVHIFASVFIYVITELNTVPISGWKPPQSHVIGMNVIGSTHSLVPLQQKHLQVETEANKGGELGGGEVMTS